MYILVKNDVFLSSLENQNVCSKDLETLISILNPARFNEVCEERLSMNKCCNIKCAKSLDQTARDKARTLRFILSKEKGCQKLEEKDQVSFCDGNLANSKSCVKEYKKIKYQVEFVNEGGPFGIPMRNLVDLLKRVLNHPEMLEIDKKNITKALDDFDAELKKVTNPIHEKDQVTKRVVKIEDGNPSDKNFKK